MDPITRTRGQELGPYLLKTVIGGKKKTLKKKINNIFVSVCKGTTQLVSLFKVVANAESFPASFGGLEL